MFFFLSIATIADTEDVYSEINKKELRNIKMTENIRINCMETNSPLCFEVAAVGPTWTCQHSSSQNYSHQF